HSILPRRFPTVLCFSLVRAPTASFNFPETERIDLNQSPTNAYSSDCFSASFP
ncbi:hypothetical protein LINPERPRIM_LOCUS21327, partial [Linum perenne]